MYSKRNPEMLYVLLKRWNDDQDFNQLSAVRIPKELYDRLITRAYQPSALQLEDSTYKQRIIFYSQSEDVSVEFFCADMKIRAKSGESLEIQTIPKLNDLGIYSKYLLSGYALLFVSLVAFIFVIICITTSCRAWNCRACYGTGRKRQIAVTWLEDCIKLRAALLFFSFPFSSFRFLLIDNPII